MAGSVAEVVLDGRSGLLVDQPDVDLLAAATSRLLTDHDERRRMGAAAREHATRSFGRARLVEDLQDLYARAVIEEGVRL